MPSFPILSTPLLTSILYSSDLVPLLAHHVRIHRQKSFLAQSHYNLSCWIGWHFISCLVWQNELSVPDTRNPVCSALYFLMTKCLCETIEVDFSPNPGYSVGSLCDSGSQRFRQLTKHNCFTSAPLAACNAFHTRKERWAREWGGVDNYSNACWAVLDRAEGRATLATITHHSTALNLENASWTQVDLI